MIKIHMPWGDAVMTWELHNDATPDVLGLLPGMLDPTDPDPAAKQFHKHYQHGGGWLPMQGFTLQPDNRLYYPGDPPLDILAVTHLRDETIILYDYEWVAIIQPDRSFSVCRMD